MTKQRSKSFLLITVGVYFAISCFFFFEALLTPHLNYAFPFVGYGGTFRYHSIHLGSVSVSLYWLMHGVGVVGMVFMCLHRAPAFGISTPAAVVTAILLAVFGFIGAKILYILENWRHVMEHGISLGGVSFFGTVFFMPLVIPLMGLAFRKKPLEYLDYCTPAGLVMLTCIRTGCFLHGCCGGITFWAFERPVTLPSQLIECTLDLILLSLLLHLEQRKKGQLYAIFMGGYGALRFFVEFLRNTPKNTLLLSHGQWFSICCMVICAAVCLYNNRRQVD